ncbi:MAG: hypothetical protein IPK78_15190 [Rhodospirillales bacterium]|nr:hypothetical protein [Rhodospirillales bacterium]
MMSNASGKSICSTITTLAGTLALLVALTGQSRPAQAANPLLKQGEHVEVADDDALDAVKGSGSYTDYYGYYGNLYAYYAYIYSYYGRYYYTSGSGESSNSYYTAAQYSLYSYVYNYYAYYFGLYGY